MELHEHLRILRRRWLTVVVTLLATIAAAAVITLLTTPTYTATTRLFFGVQGGESVTDMAQGSTFTEKQMSSYAEVATSPLVLNRVIATAGLQTTTALLADKVQASVPPDTMILEISATDEDAARAARIANAVGLELSRTAGRLSPERPDGSEAVRTTTLAGALVPAKASSPNVIKNLALGGAVGVLLGIAVALIRSALDTKIRGEADVQAVTATPLLGVVPFDMGARSQPVAMHRDPLGARSEAVRRLRTNLQFVDLVDGVRSLVVTSSIPGEGKSTTVINLAVSLADSGSRVVLVDADLRRPSIAPYLGMEGGVGLTTVLLGRVGFEQVVQTWQGSSLDILPAGQIPPNPSELLGSNAMSALLAGLLEAYDIVLLDSSPLLPVTDAAILTKLTGGALVVVGAENTHRPQLQTALESLVTVDANVLGIVLNKVARRDADSYVYYTNYSASVGEHDSVREVIVQSEENDNPNKNLVSKS